MKQKSPQASCGVLLQEKKIRTVKGNITGLKPNQLYRIQKIYQRRISPNELISIELSRYLTELSAEIKRQICILVNRKGHIEDVIIGDAQGIYISEMNRYRAGKARFRGLRCIHTHLKDEELSKDDLLDLALLRFDMIAAIEVLENSLPGKCFQAHLVPGYTDEKMWEVLAPVSIHQVKDNFLEFIHSLEEEFARYEKGIGLSGKQKKAILVGINLGNSKVSNESIEELKELAISRGFIVLDIVIQNRHKIDPKYIIGRGKLKELLIKTLQFNADIIIFNNELSAQQSKALSEATELEVIDRTQLILDIFARRAKSREGKIQVELAQLKYSLPRLVLKDDFLSRITGGIGARGPGETKLEIYRRRITDRISHLEKEINLLMKRRKQQRQRRDKASIPIISIIGYTNAGKSTLLNNLTESTVFVENKLFATLDPTTRRLRFPREREVIITDTVGFIKDLPKELLTSFSPTLEELREADLLIHLVDMSSPNFPHHIETIEEVTAELALDSIPSLLVFNKEDAVEPETAGEICKKYNAFSISAINKETLRRLTNKIQNKVFKTNSSIPY